MSMYEVEVIISEPMTERTDRFLRAAKRSANRILRFSGNEWEIRLTVEAAGVTRHEAIRQATRDVAKVFPYSKPEFVDLRQRPADGGPALG